MNEKLCTGPVQTNGSLYGDILLPVQEAEEL